MMCRERVFEFNGLRSLATGAPRGMIPAITIPKRSGDLWVEYQTVLSVLLNNKNSAPHRPSFGVLPGLLDIFCVHLVS